MLERNKIAFACVAALSLTSCAPPAIESPDALADRYFDRIHMNCDGNVLVFSKNHNVQEFKDGLIEKKMEFFEPSPADKLNDPSYKGSYRYVYLISSDAVRTTDFTGNRQLWRNVSKSGVSEKFEIEVFEYDNRIEFNVPGLPNVQDSWNSSSDIVPQFLDHLQIHEPDQSQIFKKIDPQSVIREGWEGVLKSKSPANVSCEDFRSPAQISALLLSDENDPSRPIKIIKNLIETRFPPPPKSWSEVPEFSVLNPGMVNIPWGETISLASDEEVEAIRSYLSLMDKIFNSRFSINSDLLIYFDKMRNGENRKAWFDFICSSDNPGDTIFGSHDYQHRKICNGLPPEEAFQSNADVGAAAVDAAAVASEAAAGISEAASK